MPTDLWRFAEELYQRPGVEAACLQLQEQGADICLLLCAAWLDRRQAACSDQRCDVLRSLARPWQEQVVLPLRQLRQGWRAPAQSDKALAQLREQVKRLELSAERELLQRLAAISQDWPSAAAAERGDWLEQLTPEGASHDALQVLRVAAACMQV
ncbi:TIGR02444 family protein [Pseudomonas sp.]|uniref:TIGR02444 family protein n=1 Tax=Pseudomonas sp. TaxID=306 RepID=UPI002736BF00|nr:TIGR02444 family protein [Pseudomonas sp.]MDP3816436.1 TIGR02444 family protein [Pseudomonas sp.]